MDDIRDDSEYGDRTARFESWLNNAGVSVSSSITLADLRERHAGRAVIATKDIAADEELFSIPRSMILTVETSDLPVEAKKVNDPWLSLILAMIYEYHQGTESRWKAYFDVLPEQFDTLMYWSEHDLQYLEGSAVVSKIGKKSADKAFIAEIIPIIRAHSEIVGGKGLSDDDILRLCHRMGSIIMAYAFDLERTSGSANEQDGWEEYSDEEGEILPKGMVPLADMLNADADRNNAKLFYEDDKVVMKALRDVQAGEELFNDYGPLPSADVLRRYGYVTENYAKYDVVEVSLDLIKSTAKQQLKIQDKVLEVRTSYLDEAGILDDGYDISRPFSEDGQFSDEICALLNALAMSQEDFDNLRKKEKLPKPELSKPSWELLYSILVRRRSLYPSRAQDVEMLSSDDSERRRGMARQVISGEKQVLREAAESVQHKLSEGKKRKVDTFEEEAEALRKSTKEAKTT